MSKEQENSMTEKQQENKKEDKKAFGKFALILLCAFVAGIVIGFGSSLLEDFFGESSLKDAVFELLAKASIYGAYIYTTLLIVVSIVLYKKSRVEYTSWDDEDEEVLCGIETKLSYVIWFSHLIMYGAYFFLSVGVWATDYLKEKGIWEQNLAGFLTSLIVVLVHIAYALVATCILQQKVVNFSKEINPEKNGSVYDVKFQDKWLESCDEAERYTVYKCSFKTFKVMQVVGIVLWLICILGQMFFGTGPFATIVMTIFMIIMVSVYCIQGIYFAKHPSEVMK